MRLIRKRRLRRFEGSSRSTDIAPADAPIQTLPLMKSESNSVEDYKVERTTLSYSAPSPAVCRSTISEVVKVCQDEKVIEEEDDEDFYFSLLQLLLWQIMMRILQGIVNRRSERIGVV
ncbi:hypothetical protein Tco_1540715 [Tanacetum coccineum]